MDSLGLFEKGSAKLRNSKEMGGPIFWAAWGFSKKINAKLNNLKESSGSNCLDRLGLLENVSSGPRSLNKTTVPTVSTNCAVFIKATTQGNVI